MNNPQSVYFFIHWLGCLVSLGIWGQVNAQQPLEQVEIQLQTWSNELLEGTDFQVQLETNKEFSQLLAETLRRPDSYSYPFDSLKSISILTAEDNSFRLFTWHLVKRPDNKTYYGEIEHYYFGLVQRKYTPANGPTEYLVIPLIEMEEIPRGVETEVLDNYNWLGALYYPAKGRGNEIPVFKFKYYDPKQIASNGKIKQVKQNHYVLLGWNGMDNTSNLKSVEVMSFDPENPKRVLFGAPIFFFDPVVPKSRALFRYSEYAPFGLNFGYAKGGLFGLGKEEVILFDHLANPGNTTQKLTEIWEMGPDGSYDALALRGGAFEWYKNIEVVSTLSRKQATAARDNQEQIIRARLAEAKRMAQYLGDEDIVAEIEAIEQQKSLSNRSLRKLRQQEKRILQKQDEIQAAEQERLKEAGIQLNSSSDSEN